MNTCNRNRSRSRVGVGFKLNQLVKYVIIINEQILIELIAGDICWLFVATASLELDSPHKHILNLASNSKLNYEVHTHTTLSTCTWFVRLLLRALYNITNWLIGFDTNKGFADM